MASIQYRNLILNELQSLTLYLFFFCRWDDELAEVAQIWADQCANVVYFHNSDIYPRIFHERGFERTTSRFNSAPGNFFIIFFNLLL